MLRPRQPGLYRTVRTRDSVTVNYRHVVALSSNRLVNTLLALR